MKFTLSEEDADRLGCPREIEFREDRLMGREAIALSKIGWSMERLGAVAEGVPVMNSDGTFMHAKDEHGNEVKDPAGQPIRLMAMDPEALLVMAWIAVRRVGCDVPWKDFDIDLASLAESIGEEEPGKAGPPPRTSSTRSRKSTSSTRRR